MEHELHGTFPLLPRKRNCLESHPVCVRKKRLSANNRERSRMGSLREAFQRLRKHIPRRFAPTYKHLPKIKILRFAIRYISDMSQILKNQENQAEFGSQDKSAAPWKVFGSDDGGYGKSEVDIGNDPNQTTRQLERNAVSFETPVPEVFRNGSEEVSYGSMDQDQNYFHRREWVKPTGLQMQPKISVYDEGIKATARHEIFNSSPEILVTRIPLLQEQQSIDTEIYVRPFLTTTEQNTVNSRERRFVLEEHHLGGISHNCSIMPQALNSIHKLTEQAPYADTAARDFFNLEPRYLDIPEEIWLPVGHNQPCQWLRKYSEQVPSSAAVQKDMGMQERHNNATQELSPLSENLDFLQKLMGHVPSGNSEYDFDVEDYLENVGPFNPLQFRDGEQEHFESDDYPEFSDPRMAGIDDILAVNVSLNTECS